MAGLPAGGVSDLTGRLAYYGPAAATLSPQIVVPDELADDLCSLSFEI